MIIVQCAEVIKSINNPRVSVWGVVSLGGHFSCLCRGFDFYDVKKHYYFVEKKREILLHFFIVRSLQKEQNNTNLQLWPPICRNKRAITPKWINSQDTNFTFGNWSFIVSLFSIWALKPVYFSHFNFQCFWLLGFFFVLITVQHSWQNDYVLISWLWTNWAKLKNNY
jgi:hypothetical protein